MNNILNKSNIGSSHNIGKIFQQSLPFKHVVIEDFFTKEFCQELLDEFPSFDEKLAINENGEVGNKVVHEHISDLGNAYKKLNDVVKSQEFIELISIYTGIKNLKHDPYYFGGGTHNNLNGQYLDPHVDFTHHPISGRHRRLNLIVYLNKEWKKEWGGNIELHKNPRLEPSQDEIISIEPLFNRAVIFETNNISWHGFPRIDLPENKKDLSRKSFALYYYTNRRDKKVKPHSTIYVERHLPERIQQGTTLSAEDYQEIKTLLARRDQHLERLYGYITELTAKKAGLKNSLKKIITLFKS
ncbi:MAG: 2OG-Fe(II) oxygenase [Xanthomonadales bacterium]|nr:2OG-Fe(II) oxygenase [Xanthomonadales bacterium]